MIEFTHVEGRVPPRIVLYALSTCAWCRKTKRLLEELGLGYDYVDVDLLTGEDSREAKYTIARWNPGGSYPTMVIDDEWCIVGYKEDDIRQLGR